MKAREALPLLLALPSLATAQARVWHVDDDAPAGFSEIYQAVAAAADGDTVLVGSGSYSAFVVSGKSLTIQSSALPSPEIDERVLVVTQQCQGSGIDRNANGVSDECDVGLGSSADCNGNGVPDECDIFVGAGADCDANGIPDERIGG